MAMVSGSGEVGSYSSADEVGAEEEVHSDDIGMLGPGGAAGPGGELPVDCMGHGAQTA